MTSKEDDFTKEEEMMRQARLKSVSDRAKVFKELQEYAPFQQWKREIVDDEMESLKENILSSDLTTEAGRNQALALIGAYQQTSKIWANFGIWDYYGKTVDEILVPPKEEEHKTFNKNRA